MENNSFIGLKMEAINQCLASDMNQEDVNKLLDIVYDGKRETLINDLNQTYGHRKQLMNIPGINNDDALRKQEDILNNIQKLLDSLKNLP